jgi:hypothetical protein
MPIYFRCGSGNIANVFTLKATLNESNFFEIKIEDVIFEAGYFYPSNMYKINELKIL